MGPLWVAVPKITACRRFVSLGTFTFIVLAINDI